MYTNRCGAKIQTRLSMVESGGQGEEDEHRCPICNSRIDEFGYCACGGNLGVS